MSLELFLITLAAGLGTYLTRLSFIHLMGRIAVPGWFQRALRFVPPAVLSALILPALLRVDGSLSLSLDNPRLLAGIVAALIAWRSRSVLLTLIGGMLALWGLDFALPS